MNMNINMKYKNYLLASLLCCLVIGWTACAEKEVYENGSQEISSSTKKYNSRLITQFNIVVSNLDVDVTPISRSGDQEISLSDMWYAVFDTSSGEVVPFIDGESVRHKTMLTGNQLDPIDEQLPSGKYTVAFLAMVKGGDAGAVQAVKSINDTWLKTGADGTLNGDFFYGQVTVEILPEQTETQSVDMNRISALFTLNLEMMDEAQKALLNKTEIILNSALPYGAMTVGGAMRSATENTGLNVNLTEKGGSFYALTAKEEPITRKAQLIVSLSDGEEVHQRLYEVGNLSLECGKRSQHTLNLNLPFNRLGQLDQTAIIGKSQIFANSETPKEITKRSFQLANPLKVTFRKNDASIQLFSPVGIGHTEIYARIKYTSEYFKIYELDTIRPFDDITIASSLLNNEEGYYLQENGRIIKIPANANLTSDAIECKAICQSDYWKKIESIKISPTIGFREGNAISSKIEINPKRARLIVGMALNWGVMLCSPTFEKTLEEWPYPSLAETPGKRADFYYSVDTGRVDVPKEEIIKRIYDLDTKAITFATSPDLNTGLGDYGVVTILGYTEDGRLNYSYLLYDPMYDTLFTHYQGYGYVPFHELAHLLGYPDSYGVPGGNTMAGLSYVGWNDLCAMVHREMCKKNELPVSTVDIINDLDY